MKILDHLTPGLPLVTKNGHTYTNAVYVRPDEFGHLVVTDFGNKIVVADLDRLFELPHWFVLQQATPDKWRQPVETLRDKWTHQIELLERHLKTLNEIETEEAKQALSESFSEDLS
ncbi:hypothetical protein BAE46_00940 [Glaciecola punicea]|jgi:hypothetical protein|uniref:hypothetical protein n=1 Tax=Glaciecola punicea TaxID=56804 RepID=UPI0008721FE4|nr:hypothetical protein [Glaciecola punicea]OFA33308.1 hypothetical protein BAE46_00940 [Glaciecola punicea]